MEDLLAGAEEGAGGAILLTLSLGLSTGVAALPGTSETGALPGELDGSMPDEPDGGVEIVLGEAEGALPGGLGSDVEGEIDGEVLMGLGELEGTIIVGERGEVIGSVRGECAGAMPGDIVGTLYAGLGVEGLSSKLEGPGAELIGEIDGT